MGGWASNSKYPFLAALRSAAQMVSYEVSIGFVIITVLLCAGSLNLGDIVRAQDSGRFGFSRLVLAAAVPDVRRVLRLGACRNQPAAFDLVEAESELVAGFMVEYSSTPYLLFMLGEYVAIVLMCAHDDDPVPRRLAAAARLPPFTWMPGIIWFMLKICVRLLHVRDGEGDRAALSLRSADAARLEGVPADFARHGRASSPAVLQYGGWGAGMALRQ